MKNTPKIEWELERVVWDVMEECGSCGSYHPKDWYGDCRDDNYRFHPDDLLACWLTAPELLKAVRDVLPDLEHYVATHGPGPDRRLEKLMQAIAKATSK